MSDARPLPQRVVIAGDGQLGALTAVALKRALPSSEIVVIGGSFDPAALADTATSALPFTNRLHDSLGIDEDVLVRRCGASHRLAVRYLGWGGAQHEGVAAYGGAGDPALRTAFARDWGSGIRHASSERPAGSVSEALARAGRFARPSGEAGGPLAEVDYCLRWNGAAYRDLLVEYAHGLGVAYHRGRIVGGAPDGAGGLAAIAVEDVGQVAADLFLDCSGPQGLLSQLPDYRGVDWSDQLPVRGLIYARRGDPALSLADTVLLTSSGWLAEGAGRDGRSRMLAAPEAATDAEIRAALHAEPVSALALHPGRAERAWIGNVVALGDAAATFEPLGWLNLDLAHRQLALLLELLPGNTPDPRERDEFNRRAALMADRVRDFVAAHYAAPAAGAVFGTLARSPELALALDQFERRGRLPFFEETPMLVQEWAVMLDALGIRAGPSPLTQAADPRATAAAADAMAHKCEAALRAAPPYGEWMTRMLQAQ